uniref:Uncharacterized protein n=1 Tax=viral metagenome TaxID=1070528 RepID=A0A6M3L5T7_9ZZZZ
MTEITESWYDSLIEDCKDIVVEHEFASRWALVEGYHTLGSRIIEETANFERSQIYGQNIVQCVAQSLGKKKRTIYYAVKFASLYPDLNLLPEGKNISFHHVINKYLTAGEEKPVKITPTEMIRQIKQLLQTEYMKAHQEEVGLTLASYNFAPNKAIVKFIRYLQDQVEKITGGIHE